MPQETLEVTAVSTPNNWGLGAGADKVVAVNSPDDADTSYINATALGAAQQQYAVANTSALQAGDTVNFVRIRKRMAKAVPSHNVGAFATAVLGGSTSNGATVTPAITYADTDDDFATKPGGGAWAKADVDAVEIRLTELSDPELGNGTIKCTTFKVIVDYTPAPSGPSAGSLRLMGVGR